MVRPEDVDAAVALGVDAIGLVFYPESPRLLDAEHARRLRERLPSFVACVGLFVDEEPARVRALIDRVGLDVVQFHGHETVATCEAARSPRTPYWRAVRMTGPDDLLESARLFTGAEALVLDSYSQGFGGSGEAFDWSWVRKGGDARLILAGGLDPLTVGSAIERVAPFAVDVSSGIQGAGPRTKDWRAMERFVNEVAAADSRSPRRVTSH